MLRRALIFSSSKRQVLVSQSSCESAGKEKLWLHLFFQELCHISAISIVIWADNQGAIALAKNPEFHKYIKYINMKFY